MDGFYILYPRLPTLQTIHFLNQQHWTWNEQLTSHHSWFIYKTYPPFIHLCADLKRKFESTSNFLFKSAHIEKKIQFGDFYFLFKFAPFLLYFSFRIIRYIVQFVNGCGPKPTAYNKESIYVLVGYKLFVRKILIPSYSLNHPKNHKYLTQAVNYFEWPMPLSTF